MAITSLTDYASSLRQTVRFNKNSQAMNFAGRWNSYCLVGGNPTSIAAIGSTTQGVVPVAGNQGFPSLQATSGSLYITRVECSNPSLGARVMIYDRLFHCGSYLASGGSGTLTSQPSFSGRLPGGSYAGLQLWLEDATNSTNGNIVSTVTYTNEAGTTGQSTSQTAPNSAGSSGEMLFQFPLATGDKGISAIESVSTAAGPSGSYNVFIARPLFLCTVPFANKVYDFPLEVVGAPQIYSTSALAVMVAPFASVTMAGFEISIEISSG